MFCLGPCDNGFAGAYTGKEGVGKEAEKPSLGRQAFRVRDQKRKSLEKQMAHKSRCRLGQRATRGRREDGDEGTGGRRDLFWAREIECSRFWELEAWAEGVEAELEGRGKLSRSPPPALTSHPEASGKGKSMGSLSARGLWLEFDPCRVFTDLETIGPSELIFTLRGNYGSPNQDKATFYSMKICHPHPHSADNTL